MHYFIVEPIYNYSGHLYAVEVLTRFEKSEPAENREKFFRDMSANDKLILFIEQIEEIERNSSFFTNNEVLCSVNVDYLTLRILCSYPSFAERVFSIPYLRLELNENTTPLEIRHIHTLTISLSSYVKKDFFWLDDFSSSRFSPAAYLTWGMHINLIKIDRSLLLKNDIYELGYQIGIIKNRNCTVIVEGVETTELADAAFSAGADYIQGFLFPATKLSSLEDIPKNVHPDWIF